MMDGSISYIEFDEIISVRIKYDKFLESKRHKLNSIIDDTRNINQPHSKTKIIDLTDAGKKRVEELIIDLEQKPNDPM